MGKHDKYKIVTVMIFAGGVGKVENKKNKIYRSLDGSVNEECQCEICWENSLLNMKMVKIHFMVFFKK